MCRQAGGRTVGWMAGTDGRAHERIRVGYFSLLDNKAKITIGYPRLRKREFSEIQSSQPMSICGYGGTGG